MQSIVGRAWGSTILFNLRTHVCSRCRRACLSSACSAASLSNCLVRKRIYDTCTVNENILWNASLRATRRMYICSHCISRVKNDSQKAQKRLCCWVLFLVAFLWALYKEVICRVLRLGSCEILERGGRWVGDIPSSDACILAWGRGWSVRFVSYDFLLVWSCPRRVFESHTTATQRVAILSTLHLA